MKERRKKQALQRKNFLPTLVVVTILSFSLTGLIYFIDPATFGAAGIFFLLIFTILLLSFSVILGNTRRGILVASSLTIFLLLRYLGVGNLLNFILIVCIALAFEIYWASKV